MSIIHSEDLLALAEKTASDYLRKDSAASIYQPASTAITTSNISSQSVSKLWVLDVRGEARQTDYFDNRKATFWFNQVGNPEADWFSGVTVKGWTNDYQSWQLASGSTYSLNGNLYYRNGINSVWQNWRRIGFADEFLPLTGGNISKNLSVQNYFYASSIADYSGSNWAYRANGGNPIFGGSGTMYLSSGSADLVHLKDGNYYPIIDSSNIGRQSVEYATYSGIANNATLANNLVDVEGTSVEETFSEKTISVNEETAEVRTLRGNTVAWNNLAKYKAGSYKEDELTVSCDGSSVITLNGSGAGWSDDVITFDFKAGHKCLLVSTNKLAQEIYVGTWDGSGESITFFGNQIKEIPSNITYTSAYHFYIITNAPCNNEKVTFNFFDLTAAGIADQVTTVEDFFRLFPEAREGMAFNQGQLVNFTADAIKVKGGINIWDEQWESGTINDGGVLAPSVYQIRSKNHIPITPDTTYYYNNKFGTHIQVAYYDANKNYIRFEAGVAPSPFSATSPSNAYYIKFRTNATVTSYNDSNRFCINVSDPSINGKYFPYEEAERNISITDLRSTGGEVIFPDGMKKAGNVYDEVRGRKAWKRIAKKVFNGTEGWNYDGYWKVFYLGLNRPSDAKDNCSGVCNLYNWSEVSVYTGLEYPTKKSFCGGNIYLGSNVYKWCVVDVQYASLDAWKAHLAELYAQGNPLEVIYETDTPIEYDLPYDLDLTLPVRNGSTISLQKDGMDAKDRAKEVGHPVTAPLNATIAYYTNSKKAVRDILGSMDSWTVKTYGDQDIYGLKKFEKIEVKGLLTANDIEATRMLTAEKIGIRTADPLDLLDVRGNSAGIRISSISSSSVYYTRLETNYDYNNTTNLYGGYGGHRLLNAWGTSMSLNPDGGNVGVGRTDPQATLDVNGTTYCNYFTPTLVSESGVYTGLVNASHITGAAAAGDLALWAQNHNIFSWGNFYMLDGSLGVRTFTPATTLDVNGDIRSQDRVYIGTSGAYLWYDAENNCIRTNVNFAADGDITAGA